MIRQHLSNKCSIYKLCIVLYVIFLLVLLRNDVRYLKIQSELYHDDTAWKYHEWEVSSIEADGLRLDVQEAYPSIEYACLSYSPSVSFESITFANPGWRDPEIDTRTVSIALGNAKIYESQMHIEDGVIRLEQLDSVWQKAETLYYIYIFVLFGTLLVGAGVTLKWLISHRADLLKMYHELTKKLLENWKKLLTWGAVLGAFCVISLIALKTGRFFEDQQGFLPRLEWFTYIGALLCVYTVSYILLRNRKNALLATVIAAVPLFLSIHNITLYQTKDERNNITELMWLSQDVFRHWSFTNARTHYLLMGTVWKLIPEKYAMIGVTPIHMNSFQAAKVLHWICGFLVTMGMIGFAYKRFASKEHSNETWRLALLFLMVFSLPAWALGMKMYNYDLFSMLFCVWGIMLAVDYLLSGKAASKIWCLTCMGLALQEKEFVIVYMLLSMTLMLAYDICQQRNGGVTNVVIDSIVIYLVPFIPIAFTDYWVSMVLRGGNRAVDAFERCLNSYAECPLIVLNKLGVSCSVYMAFVITYACMFIGAVVCFAFFKFVYCRIHERKADLLIADILLGLFVLLSVIGILFAFKRVNISEAHQGSRLYVLLANIYGYIGYVPSIYLILVLILFLYLLLCRRRIVLKERQILLCLITAVVLGGITWINIIVGSFQDALEIMEYRYQNIQQLINIFCIWILMCLLIKRRQVIVGGIVFAGVLLETVWSMPGFVIFYPVWNTTIYREGFLLEDDIGMGNGMAGEMIERYCIDHGISFENAHMYSSNFTLWGDNNYGIDCQYLKTAVANKECEWDDNDFYVVFSNSIPENNVQVVIPEDIAPIMTIQYRGIERIWIYQGTQLRDCYPFNEW